MKTMSNEVVKQQSLPLDNFATWDDRVQTDGDDTSHDGVLNTRVRFTNQAVWELAESAVNITGKELVAVDVRRLEIKWVNKVREDVVELGPNDVFRDLDALNASCDKSEWSEDLNGNLRGPWQRQNVLELIDIATMQAFSWPTSTIGGAICIRELKQKIVRMRQFRGEHVYPLVKLSHTRMKTRHGPRQRPHMEIVDWYRVSGGGVEVAAQPRPALTGGAAAQSPLQKVSEPSVEEELNDKIPW
jgi:hypothetical protein